MIRNSLLVTLSMAALWAAESLTQQAPATAAKTANPFQGKGAAKKAGSKLYAAQCAGCHGQNGQGIGQNPSLASTHVKNAKPGALYWVLENGNMAHGMPAFKHLSAEQRWQIVSYLQSM